MTLRRALSTGLATIAMAAATLPAQQVPQWRLVREWRVGGEPDGAHSFDFNFGLARMPGGGFVHYDYKTAQLHFLDARGGIVRSAGRPGGGPGEMQSANGFAVLPDGRIVVNDRGNGRFTVFGADGKFAKVQSAIGNRNSMGNMWRAIPLRDGRLIEIVDLLAPEPEQPTRTLLWAANLSRADTIERAACDSSGAVSSSIPVRNSAGKSIVLVRLPLAEPDLPSAYDPAGYKWELRHPASNELVRRRIGSCAATATIRLGGPRVAMPRAERDRIAAFVTGSVERDVKRFNAVMPAIPQMPNDYPLFRGIFADDKGNAWVERYVADRKRKLEIYSASGVHVADIESGLPVGLDHRRVVIAADRVTSLEYDQDNVAYLASYRIVRN